MRRRTLLCTCLCLFFLSHLSFAQISDASLLYDASISPSPGAGGLAQLAASPVNLSNGKANVTVPLVALPGYAMQLPVSLSYQTGGIRVNDVAGQVGLGWSLNSGGVITRIVRGRPDDEALATDRQGNGYAGPNYEWAGRGKLVRDIAEGRAEVLGNGIAINNYAKGEWDSEPDIFYFNFMGYSGRFVLDEDHKPVLVPHQDIKINLIFPYHTGDGSVVNDLRRATWVLTTPDGSSYIFGNAKPVVSTADDIATERTFQTISKPLVSPPCFPKASETIGEFASSWYLKEVISPQGNTELTFKYMQGGAITTTTVTDIKYRWIYSTNTEPPCADAIPRDGRSWTIRTSTRISNPLYVYEISSPKGKLEFTYDNNRSDLMNDTREKTGKRLTGISLKNLTGQTVKSVYLRYGQFNNGAPMLHLVGENNVPPHEFVYNMEVNLPQRNSPQIDYWGYHNGSNNLLAIPAYHFDGALPADQDGKCPCWGEGANRNSNLFYTQANVLMAIRFPTGGSVEYTYEMNSYFDGTQIRPWGGLRVAAVTTTDGSSSAKKNVITYSYLNHTPAPEGNPINGQSSGTIDPGFAATANLKFYRWFRMYEGGEWPNPIRKSEFLVLSSQAVNPQQLISGDALVYKCVAVSQEGMGKTIHRFTSFNDHPEKAAMKFEYRSSGRVYADENGQPFKGPHMTNSSRNWERGLPTDSEVYAQNGYIKSWKHLEYEFNPPHPAERSYGLVVQTNYSGVTSAGTPQGEMYGYYTEEPLWVHLKQVTEKVYDQNDPAKFAQSSSFYEYSLANLRVTKETHHTDDEARLDVVYKYPHSYDYLAQQASDGTALDINKPAHSPQNYKAVINEMRRRHMSGYVIEKQVWQQKTAANGLFLLSADLSQFKFVDKPQGYRDLAYSCIWPTNFYYLKRTMILPHQGLQLHTASPLKANPFEPDPLKTYTATVLSADGTLVYDNQFSEESTVDRYSDLGQVLETHGKDDIHSAMLWSKVGGLPVASAVNAHYNQVAFTSFESYQDACNWTFSPSNVQTGNAKTGLQSYRGLVESSSLTAGKYKVSGWYKGGSITINDATTLPSVNGWTYFEQVLTNPATVKVETAADASLDELRLHPVGARMNTSTYQELVGPSDQSDLNSRTAYAEYDADKRLQLVKDNQGDIVKYYRYHYQSQEGPRWEYTGTNTCVLDENGPTGYQAVQQKDENPASPSYGQFRTLTLLNSAVCQPCSGEGKKWINESCVQGEKQYQNSYQREDGKWVCTYVYYFFQDTSYSGEYTEINEYNSCQL